MSEAETYHKQRFQGRMFRDISDHLENEAVLELEGSLHQQLQPFVVADELRISYIARQIYAE